MVADEGLPDSTNSAIYGRTPVWTNMARGSIGKGLR